VGHSAPAVRAGGSGEGREVLRHLKQLLHLRARDILELFEQTFSEWSDDKAPRLGASLAFYTLLSLAPLLIVLIAVAALAFGSQAARGQLAWQIQNLVGPEGAKAIQALLQASYKPSAGIIAAILGFLTLLWGASSVAVELRDALNTIWHVPSSDETRIESIRHFMRDRLYGFALVLGVGFLLFVSLLLNAFIAAAGRYFGQYLAVPEAVLQAVTSVVSFVVITILFAAIYKVLPNVHLKWSDVIVGAAFTSFVFTLGKQLIALYLGKASIGSAYGAAGSLVIALVWVYYSAQLFFLGAEFTKVYTQRFGSLHANKLMPTPPQPDCVVIEASSSGQAGAAEAGDKKIVT
jgi:membrane protein